MDANMQASFQEFMMGGKAKADLSVSRKEDTHRGRENNSSSKRKKEYRPVFKAFQGRLREWKDTNEKLESALRSIGNLRDRVAWESGWLRALSGVLGEQKEQRQRKLLWRDCGFRSSGGALSKSDINSTLSHDLLQHERMMSTLRSLLALSAQNVDEMGRRLDEWMIQNLANRDDSEVVDETRVNEQPNLELAREIYCLLASDLYRKQKISTRIFDSCHNGLLVSGDMSNAINNFWKSNPHEVIKEASRELSSPEYNVLIWDIVNKLLMIP